MNECRNFVIGVDLSGPANIGDTVLVAFENCHDRLRMIRTIDAASDFDIFELVRSLPGGSRVTIGLDAPLSYNPGGGDRPADAALRKLAVAAGLLSGSIMPPTLHRMIYLTARGIAVARGLRMADGSPPTIVEVHPGAALALGGAPAADIRQFSRDSGSRARLLHWLEGQGMRGVAKDLPSSHYVAACAAALAAWKRAEGKSAWLHAAEPPAHPFDYCA
ncbi:DUF429 domain-containing protein [bacterium]|nr:DUF429 domain-containing protein [bacterium]